MGVGETQWEFLQKGIQKRGEMVCTTSSDASIWWQRRVVTGLKKKKEEIVWKSVFKGLTSSPPMVARRTQAFTPKNVSFFKMSLYLGELKLTFLKIRAENYRYVQLVKSCQIFSFCAIYPHKCHLLGKVT